MCVVCRFAAGRDGKAVFDGRSLKAIRQSTRFGRKIDTASWCAHEYKALCDLYEAGADVPRPLARAEKAILMEYVGDLTRVVAVGAMRPVLQPNERPSPTALRIAWTA